MAQSATSGGTNGSMPKEGTGGPVHPNPFGNARKGPNLDLREVDASDLIATLNAVLDAGALISLGRTSDGGAIGVYLTHDGQRFKEWASEPEQLCAIFESLREWGLSMT